MFKSYTRKSSALVGAKRAGKSESEVVQHDGKWGFWEQTPVQQHQEDVAKSPALVYLGDRRKVLREVYRVIKAVQRTNREGFPYHSTNYLRIRARNLRQSYRTAGMLRV